MSLPILIKKDGYAENGELITTCTECTVTETQNDFSVTLSYVTDRNTDVSVPIPNLRDTIRIRYKDGSDYDFKIESISYSNGVFSLSAKYKAYETAGIVHEPIVGMFTPKGMIDYLSTHLHGTPIDSTISCDVDDYYVGIIVQSASALRSTLYNQVIGATGCRLIPFNRSGLKLVDSVGSDYVKLLSIKNHCVSLSIDRSIPSFPAEIIAYGKNEEGYNGPVYGSYNPRMITGEGELYDCTKEWELLVDYTESYMEQSAEEQYNRENPLDKSEELTIKAELSSDAPVLSIGDRVDFSDSGYEFSGFYDENDDIVASESDLRVIETQYDAISEKVTSITAGDIQKDISDLMASAAKTVEEMTFSDSGHIEVETEDLDESREYSFTIQKYNDGDVVRVSFSYGVSAPVTSIEGNVFTVRFSEEDVDEREKITVNWYLYYIDRKEKELYDEGDLCDLTWSNANSAIVFDADKIRIAGSSSTGRACTQQAIDLAGYSRVVVEYSQNNSKKITIGFNTAAGTGTSNPNMFYKVLYKGSTRDSFDIPDEYKGTTGTHTGYLKIMSESGASGGITNIFLQSEHHRSVHPEPEPVTYRQLLTPISAWETHDDDDALIYLDESDNSLRMFPYGYQSINAQVHTIERVDLENWTNIFMQAYAEVFNAKNCYLKVGILTDKNQPCDQWTNCYTKEMSNDEVFARGHWEIFNYPIPNEFLGQSVYIGVGIIGEVDDYERRLQFMNDIFVNEMCFKLNNGE